MCTQIQNGDKFEDILPYKWSLTKGKDIFWLTIIYLRIVLHLN